MLDVVDLTPYTVYMLSVSAWTQVGEGPQSTPYLCRTGQSIPSVPLNLYAAAISSTGINLAWNAPVPANGMPVYTIEYRKANTTDYTAVDAKQALSFNITNLAINTQYDMRVRASTLQVNSADQPGDGNFTDPVFASTKQDVPFDAPFLMVDSIDLTAIAISWSAPSIPNGVIIQ
jgi:hypothetical protein